MSHAGYPWVLEACLVAWKHPNVYLELGAHRPKYFAAPGAGWEPLSSVRPDDDPGQGGVGVGGVSHQSALPRSCVTRCAHSPWSRRSWRAGYGATPLGCSVFRLTRNSVHSAVRAAFLARNRALHADSMLTSGMKKVIALACLGAAAFVARCYLQKTMADVPTELRRPFLPLTSGSFTPRTLPLWRAAFRLRMDGAGRHGDGAPCGRRFRRSGALSRHLPQSRQTDQRCCGFIPAEWSWALRSSRRRRLGVSRASSALSSSHPTTGWRRKTLSRPHLTTA